MGRKKRTKQSDAERAHIHAGRRAWRRYGIAIGLAEFRQIERSIWDGVAEWIADLRDMRQAYRVKIRDVILLVVFAIHIEAVVTCLPHSDLVRLDGVTLGNILDGDPNLPTHMRRVSV